MQRFCEFLKELIFAWIALAAVFVIGAATAYIQYYHYRTATYPARIQLYESFQQDVESNPAGIDLFAAYARDLFLGGLAADRRVPILRSFLGEEFKKKRTFFLELDNETVIILLSRPKFIPGVIQKEEERLKGYKINWFLGAYPAFVTWQIASVLCLLVYWWRTSYIMSYFPYRTWWFWVYGAIAFPWSLAIGLVIGISFFSRGICVYMALVQGRHAPQTYEEFCAALNQKLPETRRKWEEFFPKTYAEVKINELTQKASRLRQELQALGEKMQRTEQEYSEAKAFAEGLRSQSQRYDERDTAKWRMEWLKQFDRLAANRFVRALDIDEDRGLLIFTSTFPTLFGNFGPVEVYIDFLRGSFHTRKAHETTTGGNIHGGPGGFCFGDNDSIIRSRIKYGEINSAVGAMFESFQAQGGDIVL